MTTPDKPADGADEKKPSSQEQCVPMAALAIDGTQPDMGDDVEYTVRGKLSRIEGGRAYVTPATINDQPAKLPADTEPETMSDDDMMAAAQKADDEMPA